MNRFKSLALLTVLATASIFSFSQNANAWEPYPNNQANYDYNHHYNDAAWDRRHERELRERREREWRERHERELRERRGDEWRRY
jgi:hypothetical protein